METLLGLLLLGLVVWLVLRARRVNARTDGPLEDASSSGLRAHIDQAVQRDYGRSDEPPAWRRATGGSSREHLPPSPPGRSREAWSPRTDQLEVAGEWYRAESLHELFRRHATISPSGSEIRLDAVLVPDPSNPFDPRAVAVFVDHLHVGYMEREDAQRFHGAIASLPEGSLRVPSRQWMRATEKDTWARVTLSLPNPRELHCPNPPPPGTVLLPPGSTVQVTREEDHMAHLEALLSKHGTESVVAACLRSHTETRPRSVVELVAVDIDGEQVGLLSKAQTENFLPLVRKAEAEGRSIACRASLRGNSLKADVALHARKAHELDDQELLSLFAD